MAKVPGLGITTPASWGNRSALGGTYLAMRDVQGNRDGLWSNEDRMAGQVGGLFARQPLALKGKAAAEVGVRTKDEIRALEEFRTDAEAAWGEKTVDAGILAQLRHPDLYAAQKAVVLSQLGRTPSEVTEHIVHAAGTVAGQSIASRDVFTQLWAAKGVPSGRVVVLSPGFQETWRDFTDVIDQLNAKGHDVLVMDHQWASEVQQNAGGLDRGSGVARDVAAVLAKAQQIAKERHGDDGTVILAGNSMGGGPGAAGAAVFLAANEVKLDGDPELPKRVPTALFDPFFASTKNLVNDAIGLAARIPIANKLKAPSPGFPDLTDDKVAEQRGAQNAVLADTRAQLASMTRALPDIALIRELAVAHKHDLGPTVVVHASNDTLADPAASKAFADSIGAEWRPFESTNHVHQLSPSDQHHLVDAIQSLAVAKPGTVEMPHIDVTLNAPLAMKVSADLKTASVRYEIPMRDIDTRPLGDRAFAESIDSVRLIQPFVPEGSEGVLKASVTTKGGEATLVIEGEVMPHAFDRAAAPFSMMLTNGQHILLNVKPEKIAYDLTASELDMDRASLANQASYRAFQGERLAELQHLLANPDQIRTGSYIDGRPALEVVPEQIDETRAKLDTANARVAHLEGALQSTFDGLSLIDQMIAVRVSDPRPEDADWLRHEGKIEEAFDRFHALDRKKTQLTNVVRATQDQSNDLVSGYRRQLMDVTREAAEAATVLKAALGAAVKRLEQLGQKSRLHASTELLHPLAGEPERSYERATGEARFATQSLALYSQSLAHLQARAAERHARLPEAIAELRTEIEQTEAGLAELRARIENPPPYVVTRAFRGA